MVGVPAGEEISYSPRGMMNINILWIFNTENCCWNVDPVDERPGFDSLRATDIHATRLGPVGHWTDRPLTGVLGLEKQASKTYMSCCFGDS